MVVEPQASMMNVINLRLHPLKKTMDGCTLVRQGPQQAHLVRKIKMLLKQDETHQAALTRHLSHYSQDDSVHSGVAPNLKET